ncbi:transposase [Lysobacter antibioticus]|nr:transposase [Lysobacter antibioticus]
MQAICRRYVACFNARYRRSGTLWEGRFKSALIDSASYALACYRYIELNPVRAGMIAEPADYPWSSYRHNALGVFDPIRPHAEFLKLGASDAERRRAYRVLVADGLGQEDIDALRRHTQQQRAWGNDRFREQIEAFTHRAAGVRPRGRPRSSSLDK